MYAVFLNNVIGGVESRYTLLHTAPWPSRLHWSMSVWVYKNARCELPAGLWADIVLAVTESHLPVLPLPLEGGEGEERGEGLCCDTQWATAKPKCDICAFVSKARDFFEAFCTFAGSRVSVMVGGFCDCIPNLKPRLPGTLSTEAKTDRVAVGSLDARLDCS